MSRIVFISLFVSILLVSATSIAGKPAIFIPNKPRQVVKEIDSLIGLAWENMNLNFASASHFARQAHKLALANNYLTAIVESNCIISLVQANTNKCSVALTTLTGILPLALKSNNSKSIGKIYSINGICYYYLGKYDSAIYFHEKAIRVFSKAKIADLISAEYNLLAKVYIKKGDIKKAGLYYEKAVIASEKSGNKENKAWSLDILGEIYQSQQLFQQATSAFHESYLAFKSIDHKPGIAGTSLHSGNAYYMLVMDDSAKNHYYTALENFTLLGDSNGIAICYSNLSRIFLEEGRHSLAIEYANKTLKTIHGSDYKLIEAATLQQLGDIYAELKQYDKALIYINKALILAQNINNKISVMDCYKSLSEIYASMKKPDLSYKNLLLAYHYKDSLQPLEYSKQLAEMPAKYESEKKENQISLLKQSTLSKTHEIEKQANQIRMRNILIALTVLTFILLSIVVVYAAQKQKLKTALEKAIVVKATEEHERLRFAKDIHDQLGSELSKINFLSELIVNSPNEIPEIKKSAASISETAKKLVDNMRDLIWALNPENTTLANLLARIREYSSDYLEDFPAELKLTFPGNVSQSPITKEGHREIIMTVKESLNNIVKHSHASTISIKTSVCSKLLYISIKDNGAGIPGKKADSGNGLRNMKTRIESLGGVFKLESHPKRGTLLVVTIPLAKILKS